MLRLAVPVSMNDLGFSGRSKIKGRPSCCES